MVKSKIKSRTTHKYKRLAPKMPCGGSTETQKLVRACPIGLDRAKIPTTCPISPPYRSMPESTAAEKPAFKPKKHCTACRWKKQPFKIQDQEKTVIITFLLT
jgi:hypothetical protein